MRVRSKGAELVLSRQLPPFGSADATDDGITFPFLAMTLKLYANALVHQDAVSTKQWEAFIRKLIHRRADVHARVPRGPDYGREVWVPCRVDEYGTPLDELFIYTDTPAEAKQAACGWLGILSSEGYDIVAYLETEMTLHSAQHQLTCPSNIKKWWVHGYDWPHVLIFTLDDGNPSVYWDWWIDPASSTWLVCSEFRQMLVMAYYAMWPENGWEDIWAFRLSCMV